MNKYEPYFVVINFLGDGNTIAMKEPISLSKLIYFPDKKTLRNLFETEATYLDHPVDYQIEVAGDITSITFSHLPIGFRNTVIWWGSRHIIYLESYPWFTETINDFVELDKDSGIHQYFKIVFAEYYNEICLLFKRLHEALEYGKEYITEDRGLK